MKKRFFYFATGLLAMPLVSIHSAQAGDLLSTYALGQRNDPALRAAAATRDAALEVLPQSVARLLPTISVGANANYNHLVTDQSPIRGQANTNDLFWDSLLSLQLKQPLYRQEYWVQLAQADHQIAQAEAQYAAEEQNLQMRVVTTYFNTLYAHDSLSFATAEREAVEQQMKQAQAKLNVGLAAITDLHEAQAAYDRARANEIAADNEFYNAREAIREITGEYDDNLAGLQDPLPLLPPQPANLEDWDRNALQNNLNIIAADNQARIAEKTIDIQYAGHLPTLDLVGNVGKTDNNRPTGIVTEYQTVGLQLNVPIYQGGGVNSRVTQAQHQFEAAQENLDKQRRTVTRQVKNAFRGVMSAISQVEAYQAATVSAQSALNAAIEGDRVGTRTMIDVLLMQRDLYRSKQGYAKARYDYLVNGLLLRQAAGILSQEDLEKVNRYLKAGQR